MDFLKMDKNMFFSIVNMKLRDEFDSIEEFCSYYDIDLEDIKEKMNSFNMKYYSDINQIKML
ncbi:DUF4250 domain-containing protein [Candidatus Arthromitus sp. SFB-rat-Yit]|uniref:DUF4250 domain-containing protein n=1 Tax=Candidatus Arthromitus sp. SFB-rat-Yit TaxID=1041504 RepID=UPI0003095E70|nr:DUF4250 domain-containing protein [Candidatus Arthromitus sp. SFB-rat-Yit]